MYTKVRKNPVAYTLFVLLLYYRELVHDLDELIFGTALEQTDRHVLEASG
jgi:hypothetical protein